MNVKILSTSTLIQHWPLTSGEKANLIQVKLVEKNVLDHILVIRLTELLKVLLLLFINEKNKGLELKIKLKTYSYIKILFRFRGWY